MNGLMHMIDVLDADSKEWKLVPSFLRKFKVLEQQFRDLLPSSTVIGQFEDFLEEKYGHAKLMNEAQFTDYIINIKSDGVYDELIQYNQRQGSLIVGYVK